jgi:hypothetical protein
MWCLRWWWGYGREARRRRRRLDRWKGGGSLLHLCLGRGEVQELAQLLVQLAILPVIVVLVLFLFLVVCVRGRVNTVN